MPSLGCTVCFHPTFASCLYVRCVATLSQCVDTLENLTLSNWTASFPFAPPMHYSVPKTKRSPDVYLGLSKTSKKITFSSPQMKATKLIHFKDSKTTIPTCWKSAKGIASFTQWHILLSNCSGSESVRMERRKGTEWQMTSYYKIKRKFNPVYLKYIIQLSRFALNTNRKQSLQSRLECTAHSSC